MSWYNDGVKIQALVNGLLVKAHGTQESIRTAQRQPREQDEAHKAKIEDGLRRNHPQDNPFFSKPKVSAGSGLWVLSDGTYTGTFPSQTGHGESAAKVLAHLPQYSHIQDPTQAMWHVMNLSGAIRMRYVGNSYCVVDIGAKPTLDQLRKIITKGYEVEQAGGGFSFVVVKNANQDVLAEGDSVEQLAKLNWGKLFPSKHSV